MLQLDSMASSTATVHAPCHTTPALAFTPSLSWVQEQVQWSDKLKEKSCVGYDPPSSEILHVPRSDRTLSFNSDMIARVLGSDSSLLTCPCTDYTYPNSLILLRISTPLQVPHHAIHHRFSRTMLHSLQ